MLTLISLFLLLLSSQVDAQYNREALYRKTVVMVNGDPAPDISGAVFAENWWPQVLGLSDDGKVVFSAYLENGVGGITSENDQGIWVYDGKDYDLRSLMQEGGAVPGLTGQIFIGSGVPEIFVDPLGNVGFVSRYGVDAENWNTGFFLDIDGALSLAFSVGAEILPGITIRSIRPRAFNNNRLLFTCGLQGDGLYGNTIAMCMYSQFGGLKIIAKTGDPLPQIGNGFIIESIGGYDLDNPLTAKGGTVIQMRGANINTGAAMIVVYDWELYEDPTIIGTSGVDFSETPYGKWRMNRFGDRISDKWYDIPTNTRGLFDHNGDLIFREGEFIDETGDLTFTSFRGFAVDDDGYHIFKAYTSDGKSGIWKQGITGYENIVKQGGPAPGFDDPSMIFWY
ncbi:hypothetical protein JYU03_00385, partial [bacterium AH-315-F03]|nr:hypothetical protein [bacterium AH-315-F03]